MKSISRIVSLILACALALMLVACGGNAASSAASSTSASASASSEATGELVGSPWVTSVLAGNLPAQQPAAKDDLYTYYNYDYLSSHQDAQNASVIADYAGDLNASISAIVKDESKTSHDVDQLRIMYNQAADIATLQATGLSEIKPYLDRIDAVSSIDEMNALLVADDFPFSPFLIASISSSDTRETNIVALNPNFMLFDALLIGGAYYQDSDDSKVQENKELALQSAVIYPFVDLLETGMSQEEVTALLPEIINFEKSYGKYVDSPETYVKADYGAMADAVRGSYFTLDEAAAIAPNLPLKGMLDKLGKGNSEKYAITGNWLSAFNDLWVADNLDMIKLAAKIKVLGETRPFRDPTTMNNLLESAGQPVPDTDTFAYTACSNVYSLGDIVAKVYVEDGLGPNAKPRLAKLSQDLVDAYKNLIDSTPWIGEESQQRIVEKLNHITLNVLEPQGGYFDYSGLELTPSDQGGTLLSNYLKAKQYRLDCESAMIGQPAVAAIPWFSITPTMQNAFYDPISNSINILPGFVTSLIYSEDMSDTELLASAGWTIAHEISHGFDYSGSQLDAYGAPNPVFTDADIDSFVLKCSTLALYYNKIEVMPGQMVDGQLVIGEAAADLCGYQASLELASKIEGFDYSKYFETLSHMWAHVAARGYLQLQTLDTHPLNNLRINVNTQMLDAMYETFGVVEGDGMYLNPSERIVIWGPRA